jgi:hypothetical protein
VACARYHSLVIAPASLPPALRVVATAADDGEIMAVVHREHPVVGLQCHPESAASEYGYLMIDRFLHGARARVDELPRGADGARSPRGVAEATGPWVARREADGPFLPPPVELVR